MFRANPQGTHWYHSHMRYQRDHGLFGMLIVFEGKSDIHDIDKLGPFIDQPERKTLAVRDIIKKADRKKGPSNPFCLPDGSQVPMQFEKATFLINGLRGSGRAANTSVSKETHTQFYVVPGKRYRFRILDASISNIFIMSIDDHKMKVMATDGYLVKPFTTDFLIFHVAERYDFILEAKKDVKIGTKFPIRISTLAVDCTNMSKVAGEGFAYLVYTNNTKQERVLDLPTQLMTEPNRCSNSSSPCNVLNCPFKIMPDHFSKHGTYMKCHNILSLQLLYPSSYYHIPNIVERESEFFFNYHALRASVDLINGIKFLLPQKPIVESVKIKNECAYPVACTDPGKKICTHTAYLKNFTHATRFVYSSIVPGQQKGRNVTHPIHMHGHSYFIAKIGYPEYYPNGTIKIPNPELHVPECGAPNWKNGTPGGISVNSTTVRKDTVIVPAGGYVVIHFFQDDPGWWFMHCHIDYHLEGGMAIAIGENHHRASDPPKPLHSDSSNFCFTHQEFLDKEFSLAISYKVGQTLPITVPPPEKANPPEISPPPEDDMQFDQYF